MSYRGLLNQPLTIQRRGSSGIDPDYGNEVPTTTSSVATEGYVEQTAAEEITVDRETYRTDWRVFLPAGTAIDGSDRIVLPLPNHPEPLTLEVIGAPHEVWNPRSREVHHIELRCREVVGQMGRFVPSPGFESRAKRDPDMRRMLRNRATRAAGEAERIGRGVASSYTATVEDTEDGVRIDANTDGINAASWVEFGTARLPAAAPLRKGTEAAGLKTRGGR